MAAGELTIGIPGAGSSDFNTTDYPTLTLNKWPRSGPPRRGRIGAGNSSSRRVIRDRSIAGTAQKDGLAYIPPFQWPVSVGLTLSDARLLTNLNDWADSDPDNNLRLIDEIRYLNNFERTRAQRSLLTELSEPYNSSIKYGFGVFPVIIELGSEFEELLHGYDLDGNISRVASFVIREV